MDAAHARKILSYQSYASELGTPVPVGEATGEYIETALQIAARQPPEFPLAFGASRRLVELGALGHALMSCRDIAQAVETWGRFIELSIEPFLYRTVTIGDKWIYSFQPHAHLSLDAARFFSFEMAATFFSFSQEIIGWDHPDTVIEFCFPRPDAQIDYARFLPGAQLFGRRSNRIILPVHFLKIPISSGDPEILSLLRNHLRIQRDAGKQGEAASAQVRRVLMSRKLEKPSIGEVAHLLGLSKRTLNRRLAEEELTYAQILEEFRRDYAAFLMQQGRLCTKEIAHALGFRNSRSLGRAFAQWTGKSMTAWRNQPGLSKLVSAERSNPGDTESLHKL